MSANEDDPFASAMASLSRYSGPKPPDDGMNVPLHADLLALVGRIIVQWTNVCTLIHVEIALLSDHQNVPPKLKTPPRRREMKYQIGHLKELAPIAYQGGRADGLDSYFRNLDKILQLKDLRDGLAHGGYEAHQNSDPSVLKVRVHGKVRRYTQNRLASISLNTGKAAAFFINFSSWHYHELHRAQLAAVLQRLREPDRS